MQAHIITRNPEKQFIAQQVFGHYGITTDFIATDYPEIQADTSLEIARHTAASAARELKMAVIREDHSFFIGALAFPGPYMSYLQRHCPAEKILSLLKDVEDRSACFEIATVYARPDGNISEHVFRVPVEIARERRGDFQANWDTILKFPAAEKTFAEYPLLERWEVWGNNFEEIAREILRDFSEESADAAKSE